MWWKIIMSANTTTFHVALMCGLIRCTINEKGGANVVTLWTVTIYTSAWLHHVECTSSLHQWMTDWVPRTMTGTQKDTGNNRCLDQCDLDNVSRFLGMHQHNMAPVYAGWQNESNRFRRIANPAFHRWKNAMKATLTVFLPFEGYISAQRPIIIF